MKKIIFLLVSAMVVLSCNVELPMSNDQHFDSNISVPKYEFGKGPSVLIDGSHHNFFTVTGLIQPLIDILISDGYRVSVSSTKHTEKTLSEFDIIVVATPMSRSYKFFFQSYNGAFKKRELKAINTWVKEGGSLLMFSEHFPFDSAIQPLLKTFDIEPSIGETIDRANSEGGLILFENERLESSHPIVSGKRKVGRVASYGGGALTGSNYSNILKLSETSENIRRKWAFTERGPIGKGNSQGLAGSFGKGKVVALGDANGFTAMVFDEGEGRSFKAGMNDSNYDWRNFVLNTFDWLSMP
jgi:hypothetical protein